MARKSLIPSQHDIERFAKFVSPEPNSGCWLWTGAYINSGYGTFRAGSAVDETRRCVSAHRFAIEATGRLFAEGEHALHKCDNKACVNPDHLYAGSREDNARDAMRRGRRGGKSLPGERNPNAKLTIDQVHLIRALANARNSDLARQFGVSATQISWIKSGRSWKVRDGA